MDNTEQQGQRIGSCTISSCTDRGRAIARFGTIDLIYCPKHRKYGEEVINTFLSDVLNYKKSNLSFLAKQELLFGGEKILDDENERKLGSWIKKEVFQRYLADIGSTELELIKSTGEYCESEETIITATIASNTDANTVRDSPEEIGNVRDILSDNKQGQAQLDKDFREQPRISESNIGGI